MLYALSLEGQPLKRRLIMNKRRSADIRSNRMKLCHRSPYDKLAGITGGIRNDVYNHFRWFIDIAIVISSFFYEKPT